MPPAGFPPPVHAAAQETSCACGWKLAAENNLQCVRLMHWRDPGIEFWSDLKAGARGRQAGSNAITSLHISQLPVCLFCKVSCSKSGKQKKMAWGTFQLQKKVQFHNRRLKTDWWLRGPMQDVSEPLSVNSMGTAQVGRGPDVFFCTESEVLKALMSSFFSSLKRYSA